MARRRRRPWPQPPRLTITDILAWADGHYERTGRWPTALSSVIYGDVFDRNWRIVDAALQVGHRRLPAGWTLTELLDENCKERR